MAAPFVLLSAEKVNNEGPLNPFDLLVVPLHVVSPSVPAPTLVDGRPT